MINFGDNLLDMKPNIYNTVEGDYPRTVIVGKDITKSFLNSLKNLTHTEFFSNSCYTCIKVGEEYAPLGYISIQNLLRMDYVEMTYQHDKESEISVDSNFISNFFITGNWGHISAKYNNLLSGISNIPEVSTVSQNNNSLEDLSVEERLFLALGDNFQEKNILEEDIEEVQLPFLDLDDLNDFEDTSLNTHEHFSPTNYVKSLTNEDGDLKLNPTLEDALNNLDVENMSEEELLALEELFEGEL